MSVLPTGLTTSGRNHIRHHNAIHASLEAIGVVAPNQTGHFDHHETIHAAVGQGLPTTITSASQGDHVAWHNTIHANVLPGPRGTVGPRAEGSISGFPSSGFVSVSAGAGTIQAAVTANGNDTVFVMDAGTYNLSSTIQPKSGQQFWFKNASSVTNGASLARAFQDVSSRPNVKVMNATISGFTGNTIDNASSSGWEIAYCDISGGVFPIFHFSGSFVHHNKAYNSSDGPTNAYQSVNAVVEDNEFGPAASSANGNKYTGTTGIVVRHNYAHGNNRSGLWFDFANFNFLCEWNLSETNDDSGIMVEANALTQPLAPASFANIVRYNHVMDNAKNGVFVAGSTDTEIYDNVIEHNCTVQGDPCAEISFYINNTEITVQDADLARNHAHHNLVRADFTRSTGRAASQLRMDGGDLPSDTTPWTTNTKANNWDWNTYELADLAAGTHFWYYPNNRTWANWQGADKQDPHSTATDV